MGVFFPEYERWYEDAVANNWGWGGLHTAKAGRQLSPRSARAKAIVEREKASVILS